MFWPLWCHHLCRWLSLEFLLSVIHSLTSFICILLGNILIPFEAAHLPSVSQSSINHQVDTLRHILPTFRCPLQGEGEHPCDCVCSVAAVSSVSRAEISWVVCIFILCFLPATPSFTLHWSPSSVEVKSMPGHKQLCFCKVWGYFTYINLSKFIPKCRK